MEAKKEQWIRFVGTDGELKLPDIMKAKKKPLDTVALADLGVEAESQFKITNTGPPPERQKGVMVADIAGLVSELKKRGLVDG